MQRRDHQVRRLEAAADSFDAAAFLADTTRDGLLQRLAGVSVAAETVLDLGTATGHGIAMLSKRFRRPHVVAVDLAAAMLDAARKQKPWLASASFVQADAARLPFATDSVDVVFANLLLPWVDDPTPVLAEIARVLRPEGLLAFATLGPDSLRELRAAWPDNSPYRHAAEFPDMHDLGDAMLRSGLRDPVLDVDHLQVDYASSERLFADLTAVGARNTLSDRQPGLTGKRQFSAMTKALEEAAPGGGVSISLELVYGHAWGGAAGRHLSAVHIDPKAIGIRRRD